MRKILFVMVLCFTFSSAQASDWVSDWFDQSTSGGPGSYNTQERGYYTAGTFNARMTMTNDYVFSASPPRLNVGCGGIDLFAGGMSYMDPEYMVEKLERIVQAAPVFAFELAMGEFCEPCKTAMEWVENTSDLLNQIQVNDCRMSKRLVSSVAENKNIMKEMWAEASGNMAVTSGQSKNPQDHQDDVRGSDGKPPNESKELIEDCPVEYREIFADGSLLDNITGYMGLEDYAPLMRGLIGDAIVTYSNPDNVYIVENVASCPANDQVNAASFANGEIYVRPAADAACTQSSVLDIEKRVGDELNGIATKIKAGTGTLTAQQEAFINASPVPVYALVKGATEAGIEATMIQTITPPLTQAYAFRILDDFYRVAYFTMEKAREVQSDKTISQGDPNKCNPDLLIEAHNQLREMWQTSLKYREMAQANYNRERTELIANMQVSRMFEEQRKKLLNEEAGDTE